MRVPRDKVEEIQHDHLAVQRVADSHVAIISHDSQQGDFGVAWKVKEMEFGQATCKGK